MCFLMLLHTPYFSHLFNKPPPTPPQKKKNRYTRNQPTHFSITPLRSKLKKRKFKKPTNLKNQPTNPSFDFFLTLKRTIEINRQF